MSKIEELEKDIAKVLNKHCVDSSTNVPDFILAKFMVTCVAALKTAVVDLNKWNGDHK